MDRPTPVRSGERAAFTIFARSGLVVLSLMSLVWSTCLLASGTTNAPRAVSSPVSPAVSPSVSPAFVQVVDSAPHHKSTTTADSAKVDTIYTCPMDPQVVKHEPGNCPLCGMKLVKKVVPHDTTTKADTTKKKSDAATIEQHQQTH